MAIPTYDRLMIPLLHFASDRKIHHIRDAIDGVGEMLGLTYEERNELLDSGSKRKFDDRVHWAKTYLTKAGALAKAGRGYFQITERGFHLLNNYPDGLHANILSQYPEFVEFQTPSPSNNASEVVEQFVEEDSRTPKEQLEQVYNKIRQELAAELLDFVYESSPAFFEKLVVDLLLAMGYGGSLASAGTVTQLSNDGGIDGYIQEDKLGLDTIYIQAKKWNFDHTIGRPEIQGFVGSLVGAGATKGVFITTSRFSQGAIDFAKGLQNQRVILLDGQTLAQLMIEHGVGVSTEKHYVLKRVDSDYFDPA